MKKNISSFFESGIFSALKAESFLLVRNCVIMWLSRIHPHRLIVQTLTMGKKFCFDDIKFYKKEAKQ